MRIQKSHEKFSKDNCSIQQLFNCFKPIEPDKRRSRSSHSRGIFSKPTKTIPWQFSLLFAFSLWLTLMRFFSLRLHIKVEACACWATNKKSDANVVVDGANRAWSSTKKKPRVWHCGTKRRKIDVLNQTEWFLLIAQLFSKNFVWRWNGKLDVGSEYVCPKKSSIETVLGVWHSKDSSRRLQRR